MRKSVLTRHAPEPPAPAPVVIERMGHDGDGIGQLGTHRVYLPLTLPGEQVTARPLRQRGEGWAGTAELIQPSPDRVTPPCPHFGPCGGCALQHWADDAYAAWKSTLLQSALRRAGFGDIPPAPLARTPAGQRRRMDWAVRRDGSAIRIGLHQRRSDTIVDSHACPILDPRLFAILAPLRQMLRGLGALRRTGSVLANLLDTGPDLLLRTDGKLSASDRAALAHFAETHGIPRIAWAQDADTVEIAAQWRAPSIRFAGIPVEPPPGAFLQASPAGEAAIAAAVLAGLPEKLKPRAHIIELYAGCGTLTAPLATRARVTAYEGDPAASHTLQRAMPAGRVTVSCRDLSRQPVMARDLAGADAVVLDPPFAGAALQVAQIAASTVGRVIYVSCNPVALAEDAALLRAAGFAVISAQPIDQFLWSSRLESVVVFSRAAARRSARRG